MSTSTIPPKVRAAVLARDGYRCIAPLIDGQAGWCRDMWGNPIVRWPNRDLGPCYIQMSHVKEQGELAMSKKATPSVIHLVSLCPFHHTGTQGGSNWEARNHNRIRNWLEDMYASPRTRR